MSKKQYSKSYIDIAQMCIINMIKTVMVYTVHKLNHSIIYNTTLLYKYNYLERYTQEIKINIHGDSDREKRR